MPNLFQRNRKLTNAIISQPRLHFIICRKWDHWKKLLPQNFSYRRCFTKFRRPFFRRFGLPDTAWHRTRIIFVTAFIKHDVLDPSGDLQINL